MVKSDWWEVWDYFLLVLILISEIRLKGYPAWHPSINDYHILC